MATGECHQQRCGRSFFSAALLQIHWHTLKLLFCLISVFIAHYPGRLFFLFFSPSEDRAESTATHTSNTGGVLKRECELKNMSHLNPGLISAYNSLTDKHLAGYFSNTRIRRHLHRAGLITRSGRIVPDKEYRHKLIQRAHQRHVRECLAQAIFHKVLELERLHQIEFKRKLEEFAKRERVHKIKVERSKRCEEDIIRILSPRPPTGARGIRKQHSGPEGEHSESSESPSSSRPNTAPGKMQRPVRLKPIHSNSTTASVRRRSPHRLLESSHENNQLFNGTTDKEYRRCFTTVEAPQGVSPYCLPVINSFVTPVPPATKRKERGVKVTPSSTVRGRRLHPSTASSGADVMEDAPVLRSSVHHSRVCVRMVYFGKTVHLSHDLSDMRDEVKVFQQHCGGENLCVFKGKLREGETFQFTSRRHRGFPFSLTFFLNGLQVERLSSCCEFKHRRGSRLGGRHGHFGFFSVEGASPCYKCIIAMGLDKKPTPPPKKVREDRGREESDTSPKDTPETLTERTAEDAASHSECETSHPQDTETQVEDEPAHEEDKARDDYEEDFEADDEGPAEEPEAKAKKSPSPTSETEKEVEEKDPSETEDDEKDEDIKSGSGSSSSDSDREESDAEDTKDSKEDEKTEQPEEADPEEAGAPPDQRDEPNPEEAVATEATVSAVAKDSDMQDSAGDSTEIEISDTSIPTVSENKQSDDSSADKEKMVEESKQPEEQERAKSVQEKLAEAILKESHCSSEPELSDTSTEEEEECANKKDNNDASPEKPVTFTEQQQTLLEETEREGRVTEVEQGPDESSEIKEQMEESETPENICSKDEKVSEVEEDEKAAEDEVTGEKDQSEEQSEAQHPINEEQDAQEVKTADPLLEEVKSTDAEAAEKDDGKEEETATETDGHLETKQVAESREDESSEQNRKTEETAVNVEAEAKTAGETAEMKSESSEEREALSCEEAPANNTEKEGGSEDGAEKVSAEDPNGSPKESRDTAVVNTPDISEETVKNESGQDEIKEEEAEKTLATEADSQQEGCELGEERKETSVGIDEMVENQKSEEEGKQTPDKTEDETTEERVNDEKDKTDEEGNDESKANKEIEQKENVAEGIENDTKGEENEGEGEKETDEDQVDEDKEKVEEPQETERDEGSEGVENKNDKEEPEAEGEDKTNEGEGRAETDVAVEQKDDDVEKSENKAEGREATENKNDEEKEDVANRTAGEGEEMCEVTEEPEKSADAVLDKESVKVSSENIVELEVVGDSEAADEAKTTEEVPNITAEAEGETERASNTSVKGEIDAENGEISTGAEDRAHEDQGEDLTKVEDDLKTAECGEEEGNTEEHMEDESKDVKESGDSAEKQEDDKVDQAAAVDVAESVAKGDEDSVQNHDELNKNNSEPETSVTEMEERAGLDGRKGNEEREEEEKEEDENGNKSNPDNENRESHLIKNNSDIQNIIGDVASSGDQEQSAAMVAVDSGERRTEKLHCAGENAACVDLSAAEGENGADTEEASKASEEGASVLLKPQAPINEADNPEQGLTAGKETPEALGREDNTDLVSKWVNVHQTSKYFETFVEPLEYLSEGISSSNKEESRPTELPGEESPPKMVRTPEDEEKDDQVKYENESREKVKTEAADLEHTHSEEFEEDPAKNRRHVEETEVKGLIPEAESEQSDSANLQDIRSEEKRGSRQSLQEDKVQEGPTQGINEDKAFSKTEVESISGTHHSAASVKLESASENQTEEKTTDLCVKPTSSEDMKDLPSLKPEERHGSKSPDEETWRETDEQSREVTEITDFTTSRSDDGSQEIRPKASEGSFSGDRRDTQLIRDLKHTLSKDRLSTFSVDETLFGHSSYPLLTAARTESRH
ncbi:glutamate-rich protein 3 [Mugil cephalus]|uniref:glutamate-rich protein 3 n=1 Tax=Mugil cephalus TaxID=48193 RepID=UPI001FB7E489|nr:glutamate-rich protein 3 [Mugil cephalus]